MTILGEVELTYFRDDTQSQYKIIAEFDGQSKSVNLANRNTYWINLDIQIAFVAGGGAYIFVGGWQGDDWWNTQPTFWM